MHGRCNTLATMFSGYFSPFGEPIEKRSMGGAQGLSGASASDFPLSCQPPTVWLRTSSSPHRLPLKGGVIESDAHPAVAPGTAATWSVIPAPAGYMRGQAPAGIQCGGTEQVTSLSSLRSRRPITPPLRGSRRSRAAKRRLMRWGVFGIGTPPAHGVQVSTETGSTPRQTPEGRLASAPATGLEANPQPLKSPDRRTLAMDRKSLTGA